MITTYNSEKAKQIDTFLDLFFDELKQNSQLRKYHRFLNSDKLYLFRRAYYQQRLEYVVSRVKGKNATILDVGCGYGTTSILLGYLGYKIIGTTLEYYYSEIGNRLDYWSKFFDTSKIEFRYENIFKSTYNPQSFDYIIVQDTLHHLEPINDALGVFYRILNDEGQILVSEENGNNIINNAKNFKRRGFKRVVKIYDEQLGEEIMFGDENTRSLRKWDKLFAENSFEIDKNDVEYVRVLPPSFHNKYGMHKVVKKESVLWRKSRLLRELFFFGINFTASKKL
jgi:SAM-dependent methyltransferase